MRFEMRTGKLEEAFKNFQPLPEWRPGREEETEQRKVMRSPANQNDSSGEWVGCSEPRRLVLDAKI